MCLIALLHLIGRAYYAGYLRVWRLPFEFMPLTNESTLEQGAYALMGIGAGLSARLLASAILVATVLVFASHAHGKLRGIGSLPAEGRSAPGGSVLAQVPEPPKMSERPQSHLSHLSHFAMDACAVVMVGIAIFGAVLLTMNASTRVGEDQARQDAACPRCLQSELTLDGHDSIIGRIIRCSNSHCIVQSEDQVLVLRLEDIKRVTNPPASADAIGHAMAP